MNNTTAQTLSTVSTTPNYWPSFAGQQYLEVVYLTIITALGTIGNLVVIFSIALERRVHLHGNIFIINLAVADFLVSGLVNPTVIANVIANANAVNRIFCDVIGYLVTSTCTCSLYNLMFIAINRYWAVVRPNTYQKVFARKRVYYMMAVAWLIAIVAVSPTVLGWGELRFDEKMMVCTWDDTKHYGYTWFITTIAIILPSSIIVYCYFRLFRTVKGSGRWVRSLSVGSGISQQSEQHRRSVRKERSLLRTLLTTVVLFFACWVPFAACVLINPGTAPPIVKKMAGWLALTNSCLNFIIYGAMNPVFRRGYHNLFVFIFRCKRAQQLSSAMLHGSFSDSFRTRRATRGKQVGNGVAGNNFSDIRENSRIDSVTGMPVVNGNDVAGIDSSNLSRKQPMPVQPAVSQITQTTVPSNSPTLARVIAKNQWNNFQNRLFKRSESANSLGTTRFADKSTFPEQPRKTRMGATNNADDEDLARAHKKRFSRRAQSDFGQQRNRIPALEQENGNCNNQALNAGVVIGVNAMNEECTRRSWMPNNAIYTSKHNTPIIGRSASNTPNGTPKTSPTKKAEVTIKPERQGRASTEIGNSPTGNQTSGKAVPFEERDSTTDTGESGTTNSRGRDSTQHSETPSLVESVEESEMEVDCRSMPAALQQNADSNNI